MDQAEPSGSNQPNAKRRRVNDDQDQHKNGDAVAATVEQTADILKLDIDCCEEAFGYMPFEDLVNVGKTCKRLQQMAGYCFQENYRGAAIFDSERIRMYGCDVKHFTPLIQEIHIPVEEFEYFADVRPKFRRLKHIRILGCLIDLSSLQKISMDKLEVLSLHRCDLGNNFHEIMDACASLKRLAIVNCEIDLNWLDRKYSTLEYFQFIPREYYYGKIDLNAEILIFLELNPNIRNFSTSALWLWENSSNILTTNITLDNLAISGIHYPSDDELFQLINLLNKLHDRGFYRKLHISNIKFYHQSTLDQLAGLNGLVRFEEPIDHCLFHARRPLTFSALKNLEDLDLNVPRNIDDLDILGKNLINLKRISFKYSTIDDIIPFIRHSVEMQKIYMRGFEVFDRDTKIIIDLLALNREREKLPKAQKITLYVHEEIYLATKWAMKETDFRLIRLKQHNSIKWNEENFYTLQDI